MPKYRVTVPITGLVDYYVEAETEEEAEQKIKDDEGEKGDASWEIDYGGEIYVEEMEGEE